MNMDLNGVIEKIKQEGVAKAETQAAEIIKKAEDDAAKIIDDAKKQQEAITDKRKEEIDKYAENATATIRQAGNNVLIALRGQIEKLLDTITKKEISKTVSEDVLKDIISKLVTESVKKGEFNIEILLGEKEKEDLRAHLHSLFQKEIEKGVEIKTTPSVKNGFRIGKKGTNVYYDFSDEAISEAFNVYLNKKIRDIMIEGMKSAG